MVAEHSSGTSVTPFLDEFHRMPRYLSVVDLLDDLLSSGLISSTELILSSKQEIVIKESSLIKHFEQISFFRKRDADRLAQLTLVMREDELLVLLTQRAELMKQLYIDCILKDSARRDFVASHLMPSEQRLPSLAVHGRGSSSGDAYWLFRERLEFIRSFHLNPICAKIFFWMKLTDETSVKTLIETRTYVNEYRLNEIQNSFLGRLRDVRGKTFSRA